MGFFRSQRGQDGAPPLAAQPLTLSAVAAGESVLLTAELTGSGPLMTLSESAEVLHHQLIAELDRGQGWETLLDDSQSAGELGLVDGDVRARLRGEPLWMLSPSRRCAATGPLREAILRRAPDRAPWVQPEWPISYLEGYACPGQRVFVQGRVDRIAGWLVVGPDDDGDLIIADGLHAFVPFG